MPGRHTDFRWNCLGCGSPIGLREDQDQPCLECRQEARDERTATLVAAWNDDEPLWSIAARAGLSETAVHGTIDRHRQHGGDVKMRAKKHREDWPIVEDLFREGFTYREIEELLGLGNGCAYQRINDMRKAGIDLPRRR